jgi:hypothetical protein
MADGQHGAAEGGEVDGGLQDLSSELDMGPRTPCGPVSDRGRDSDVPAPACGICATGLGLMSGESACVLSRRQADGAGPTHGRAARAPPGVPRSTSRLSPRHRVLGCTG